MRLVDPAQPSCLARPTALVVHDTDLPACLPAFRPALPRLAACPTLGLQELVLLGKEKELLEKDQSVAVLREEVGGVDGVGGC